jgi:hypothetical protein
MVHRSAGSGFLSLPAPLPAVCALVSVAWCLGYGVTALVLGAKVGRQSSTSAIAPFMLMLSTPFFAGAGYVLGKLAVLLQRALFPGKRAWLTRRRATIGLAAITAAAALQAGLSILAAERSARPRVLLNSAQIHRREVDLPANSVRTATRIYDLLGKVDSAMPWRDNLVHLVHRGNSLAVEFTPQSGSLSIPLTGIDYVIAVDAVALEMGPRGNPALALLITGRATGRRDLLAVISASRDLVYLELLDRFWNFRSTPLALAPSSAGDLILIGSEPKNLLAFAMQDGI